MTDRVLALSDGLACLADCRAAQSEFGTGNWMLLREWLVSIEISVLQSWADG